MSALLCPLADLRGEDEQRYGGKSASLGEMLGSGLNVPPGFAISTDAFAAFLAQDGLGERIGEHLAGIDHADVEAVRDASASIAEAMLATAIPDGLREEIETAYRALADASGQEMPAVAVRSSARGEDSADATFAGQQDTLLWVRGVDALCEAIRSCWVSLYSPPAVSYRARMDARDEPPAMGVTVQLMVDAAVSGVMFTCSPLSGDPSVVAINASWGLGLGVVGGEVTPDEFVLSKVTGEVLRRTINDKALEYLPDEAGQGTVCAEVEEGRRGAATLDDSTLATLLDLGKRVERHFGARQDIEWALPRAGDRVVYLLQARPVTATGSSGSKAVADRAGAGAMSLLLGTFGVKPTGA